MPATNTDLVMVHTQVADGRRSEPKTENKLGCTVPRSQTSFPSEASGPETAFAGCSEQQNRVMKKMHVASRDPNIQIHSLLLEN